MGVNENSILRSEYDIAGYRNLQPARYRESVDRRDHRTFPLADRPRRIEGQERLRTGFLQNRDVKTNTKGLALARQDDGRDVRIIVEILHDAVKGREHFGNKRVQAVRTVQPDRGKAIVPFNLDQPVIFFHNSFQ